MPQGNAHHARPGDPSTPAPSRPPATPPHHRTRPGNNPSSTNGPGTHGPRTNGPRTNGRHTNGRHTNPSGTRGPDGAERLVHAMCVFPLLVLDALAAGNLYFALTASPRDELDEHTLTGIDVMCSITVACAASSLLLAFLLRKAISRWWTAPALCLLTTGAARWAYIAHTYPPP